VSGPVAQRCCTRARSGTAACPGRESSDVVGVEVFYAGLGLSPDPEETCEYVFCLLDRPPSWLRRMCVGDEVRIDGRRYRRDHFEGVVVATDT